MSEFLAEYRVSNPQYNDLSDDQLVTALHGKYNADRGSSVSAEDFNSAIGYSAAEPISATTSEPAQETDFIDSAIDTAKGVGRGVMSGLEGAIPQAKLQAAGMLQSLEPMSREEYESSPIERPGTYEDYLSIQESASPVSSYLAEKGRELGETTRAEMQPDTAERGSAEYYAKGITGSIANMVPMLATSIFGRRPDIGLGLMLAQAEGGAYEEGRESGLDTQDAGMRAALSGIAEVVPSAIPVGAFMNPTGEVVKDLLRSGVTEAGQEAVTAALQSGIDKGYIDPDMTFGEAMQRVKEGAIMGAGAGTVVSAATGGIAGRMNQRDIEKQLEAEFDQAMTPQAQAPADIEAIAALNPEVAQIKQMPHEQKTIGQMVKEKLFDKQQAAIAAEPAPEGIAAEMDIEQRQFQEESLLPVQQEEPVIEVAEDVAPIAEEPALVAAKPGVIDKPIKDEDHILKAIAKLGGVNKQEATAQGIDPATFKRKVALNNAFRPKGRSFDSMAEALSELGYISKDYTANELLDKINLQLSGNPQLTPKGLELKAAVLAEDYQAALAKQERDDWLDNQEALEQQAFDQEEDLTAFQALSHQHYDLTGTKEVLKEFDANQDDLLLVTMYQRAIDSGMDPVVADNLLTEYQGDSHAFSQAIQEAERQAIQPAEDKAVSEAAKPQEEEFQLEQETEAQREAREKAAPKPEAKKPEIDEGEFVLSGSDSEVDQAEARGQSNLFDAPAKPKERGERAGRRDEPGRRAADTSVLSPDAIRAKQVRSNTEALKSELIEAGVRLSPEQADIIHSSTQKNYGDASRDPLTGFYDVLSHEPTVELAQDILRKDGNEIIAYVETDLANLGGLNSAMGSNKNADRIYKGITDTTLATLNKQFPDSEIIPFRHGGDEFSFLITGVTQEQAHDAMEQAVADVYTYLKGETSKAKVQDLNKKDYPAGTPLADIPHPKGYKTPGVGIYIGTTNVVTGVEANDIISTADSKVAKHKERAKKENIHERSSERTPETKADEAAQPEDGGPVSEPSTERGKQDAERDGRKDESPEIDVAAIDEYLTEGKEKLSKEYSRILSDKHPELKFVFSSRGDLVSLDKIIVPEDARNTGQGTKAMNDIIELADSKGNTLDLIPSADFGGTKARLIRFYKTFGFVENKGKNKDYEISGAMYRLPKKPKPKPKPKPEAAKEVAPDATVTDYGTAAIESFNTFRKTIGEQTATAESIKSDADNLVKNKDAVLAELQKLTKAKLQEIVRSPRNDWKKPQLVKQAYERMLSAHALGDGTITIFGGSKSFEEQIIDQVNEQTQEDIDKAFEKQREYRADFEKRKADYVKAMTDPETLAQFKTFVGKKGKAALSVEQLAKYDELVSESLREEDRPKVVKGEVETVDTERAQTKHSKTGEDLFVVKMAGRVEKDKFRELSGKAKALGGYYSRYSKDGAIPGFQFKTIEAADQFAELLAGKDVDASNQAEAKADIKQASNADKLLEMASKLEQGAESSLTAPRQDNTARRASMAAHATKEAYKQLAFAKTLRNIAIKLQAGELLHLGKINQVTQLENLLYIQNRAIPHDFYHSSYDGYSMDYELKDGKTIDDYIANVQFPELVIDQGKAANFAKKLDGKPGFMRFAKELTRLKQTTAFRNKEYRAITEEQLVKIEEAVKKGYIDKWELGYIPDDKAAINRLKRMGINTEEQLRAAIRELDSLSVKKQKESPIKKMERDLIGKKIDGYFPTPRELVEQMIDYADIKPGHEVLEPSAGKGNIASIIQESAPDAQLEVIEYNAGLNSLLEAKGFDVVGEDFLKHNKNYDRIVMNPPFENFQDIDHVQHAYELLKPGGKLVTIMGAGVKNSRKKAVEFRQWVDDMGSYIEDLPAGSFKSSERPTGVATVMVVLEKNDANTLMMKAEDSKPAKKAKADQQVFNAPGANYMGTYRSTGIPPRKESVKIEGKSLSIPEKPQRIEPIMRSIISIAGRRIYFGKIKGKSAEGFYRPDVGEIRTRRKNDVEVLAHELAHYLDMYSNITIPNFKRAYTSAEFKSEVAALSYTDASEELQGIEGFAEFVRLWLTNSTEAQTRAPNFFKEFSKVLGTDKSLHRKMRKMQIQMHRFYFQGADKLGQALIGGENSFEGDFSRWQYRRDSLIRQEVIDKFHAARKIEQELTGKIGSVEDSAWKQMRIANGGYEGIADYVLNYGTVNFDETGDLNKTGKSLHDVMAPVKTIKRLDKDKGESKVDLLMRYFAGRRALELHRQKRENLIPKETARAWTKLGADYPVFESIFTEYQDFNTRMMDFYQAAGLLTPESRLKMQSMNKDYVPFNRIRDSLQTGKGSGGGFHKLKGGTANLNDIMVNIQDGVTSNIRQALNNKAKERLYQYISGHKDGAIWATKLAPDSKMVKVYQDEMLGKINAVLDDLGVEIDGELDLSDPSLLTFWQHGGKPTLNESGNIVDTVIINGKPKYYEVQDPLLQEMLLTMNPESYSSFMNTMFGVKNFFTRTITLGIEFMGANLVRDTLGATFISKHQFKPFITSFDGMYSFFRKDQAFQDFLKSGGGYSSRIEASTKEGKARRRVAMDEFGVMSTPEYLLSHIDNLASAFEYGTRIGEFKLAKKAGESDMNAAYAAREISTDFSVHGANKFLTGYIRTIPFLNAMVQSQDRIYRETLVKKKYDGNPTGFAMSAFLGITVPTLMLWLINKDDEDYKQIPDHERRTNWHIKVGDGRYLKIPRPYDVGFVFATMPELFFKYMEDDKGKEYAEGMAWTLTQMYGVDGVPAAMTGWWDIVKNEKWTGAPVVPQSLADVEATQQYNANTSETFVRFGEVAGLSPIKAEHAFKAYTGYLGGYLLWGSNKMLWNDEQFGEEPAADLSENVFLRRFLTKKVRPATHAMEKFFDLKEQSDKIVATYRAGTDVRRAITGKLKTEGLFKEDGIAGLSAPEKKVLFALNDSMNDLIGILYGKEGIKTAEIQIRYDKKLTGEQKREALDKLWISRNKAFMKYYEAANKALQAAKKQTKQE